MRSAVKIEIVVEEKVTKPVELVVDHFVVVEHY